MSEENQVYYTEALQKMITDFIENSNMHRMSRTLCKVFFDYLRAQDHGLDVNFDTILNDIQGLIEFLEFAGDEIQSTKSK